MNQMKTTDRREFLKTSSIGIVAALCLHGELFGKESTPFNWPLSFQSYGVREMLGKDFVGTMKKLRTVGYKGIEMCSPKGYEKSGFGPLIPLSPEDLRKKIEDADMFCKSCHFQHPELKLDKIQQTIDYGKRLGLKDLVISAAWIKENATLDEWKVVADELNKSAEQAKKAGLQMVYHNHSIGPEINGEKLYDILMRLFDPGLIRMQFQLAVASEGADVIGYMAKYPGRYISLHIHDWDPVQKKIVPTGKGIIDWKKLLETAKKSGISDYGLIVEMETRAPGDPLADLIECHDYLSKLNI
jgi:sugar phosphate isomerase/epimerase